jgi:hypothetical protein
MKIFLFLSIFFLPSLKWKLYVPELTVLTESVRVHAGRGQHYLSSRYGLPFYTPQPQFSNTSPRDSIIVYKARLKVLDG